MYTYNQTLLKSAACLYLLRELRARRNRKTGSQESVTNIGRGLHAFAERYYQHCWSKGVQTDVEAGAEIAERMLAGSGLEEAAREDFLSQALGIVESEIVPPKGTTDLETEIHTPDGRFFGTPDIVERLFRGDPAAIRITDRKSWRRWRSDTEAKREIQLPFYAGIMATLEPHVERFHLRYVYTRFRKDYPANPDEWVLTREEALAFLATMHKRADELDQVRDFKACAGTQCDYCQLAAGSCPLVESGEVVVIKDAASAKAAAERLYAIEKAAKDLKTRLKGWIDGHEPVALDGVTLDFQRSESMEYDVATVARGFKKLGVKLEDVLASCSINQTEIKKLAKAAHLDKDAAEELLALGEQKIRTTFRFAKPDDEEGE